MESSVLTLGKQICEVITHDKIITPKISEQERVNRLLDAINSTRTKINKMSSNVSKLDELFTKLSWLELANSEEEILIKKVIAQAKKYHTNSLKNYILLKNTLFKDGICKIEIEDYKNALDDFEDTVLEIEQIFFVLRKDDEFNSLLNSI
ncbi:MAG TPA: hypothetical protein DCS19_05590 [Flavobacterium sp.]|nr:hypothetical protein [Flavobacterium sp.]